MDEAPERVSSVIDPVAALSRAAVVLRAGGTVVLPTDTVYGVAALAGVDGATGALCDLKGRSRAQPLAVLVADADQAGGLVDLTLLGPVMERTIQAWMARLWPGALTLVLPRAARAAGLELGGASATIGVRCPDHGFVRELAARVGPLATTSANRHGDPTPHTAAEAARALAGHVSLVVDGGPAGSVASTVVDACADPWRVLRAGELTEGQLRDLAWRPDPPDAKLDR